MDTADYNELETMAEEKIAAGENLITKLNSLSTNGTTKLQRKIQQELKFLQKMKHSKTLKLNHISCSNIIHFEFLVQVLQHQQNVTHLDHGFAVQTRENPLRVDIICDNGTTWIKVIARNTKSIKDAIEGRSSYGTKDILKQAEEYIEAASLNLCMFQPPKVCFVFLHDVDDELRTDLESTGVNVLSSNQLKTNRSQNIDLDIVNLDITTMIAYVSALTNKSCDWIFKEPILTEQASEERITPLKPILDELFIVTTLYKSLSTTIIEGKRLICCETARNSFVDIIKLLGGTNEKRRAEQLLSHIEILPDVDIVPTELTKVAPGGNIKDRSLRIFSFGCAMKALTSTSNKRFIRSISMQGVTLPVFIHQARALTECKEETAQPINF